MHDLPRWPVQQGCFKHQDGCCCEPWNAFPEEEMEEEEEEEDMYPDMDLVTDTMQLRANVSLPNFPIGIPL